MNFANRSESSVGGSFPLQGNSLPLVLLYHFTIFRRLPILLRRAETKSEANNDDSPFHRARVRRGKQVTCKSSKGFQVLIVVFSSGKSFVKSPEWWITAGLLTATCDVSPSRRACKWRYDAARLSLILPQSACLVSKAIIDFTPVTRHRQCPALSRYALWSRLSSS